jgi:hypothetical protein
MPDAGPERYWPFQRSPAWESITMRWWEKDEEGEGFGELYHPLEDIIYVKSLASAQNTFTIKKTSSLWKIGMVNAATPEFAITKVEEFTTNG